MLLVQERQMNQKFISLLENFSTVLFCFKIIVNPNHAWVALKLKLINIRY